MHIVIGDDMEKTLITNVEKLNNLQDEDIAIEKGPKSAMGKRKAYENLVVQQKQVYGHCYFTMFNLFTSYSTSAATAQDKSKLKTPPILLVNEDGSIILKIQTKKFIVLETVYTRYRKDVIINQCPYIPLNETDERSCYSTLLLHTIWPIEGEINLLRGLESAVICLQQLKNSNEIPKYVKNAVESNHNSHVIRSNNGTKHNNNDNDSDDNSNDDDDDKDDDNDKLIQERNHSTENHNTVNNPIKPSNITDGKHIMANITPRYSEYYENFIKNSQDDYLSKMKAQNQIDNSDETENIYQIQKQITKVNDYDNRLTKLEQNVKLLTKKQLEAYNKASEYITGKNKSQMIMFVTGEGGTGKSFLISLIMELANITHGKQKGLYGSAIALAPTGAAAKVINGYTWQSVYGKGMAEGTNKKMASRTAKAVGTKLQGVKIAILDEISMINLETLHEISERQKQAMLEFTDDENEREAIKSKPFGGLNMIFTGDFYQLKPVTGESIYSKNPKKHNSKEGQKIWYAINEYIELVESTRFKDDETPHMNKFLSGARKGVVDQFLLNKMNERVVPTVASAKNNAGPDAVWISHKNKEVNKLNDDDFKDKVHNGACYFRIQAQHTPITQILGRPNEEHNKRLLTIHTKNGTPPYLNLAIGSRISCTKNLGTQIGKEMTNKLIKNYNDNYNET